MYRKITFLKGLPSVCLDLKQERERYETTASLSEEGCGQIGPD